MKYGCFLQITLFLLGYFIVKIGNLQEIKELAGRCQNLTRTGPVS